MTRYLAKSTIHPLNFAPIVMPLRANIVAKPSASTYMQGATPMRESSIGKTRRHRTTFVLLSPPS